jgi:hypothetical protein
MMFETRVAIRIFVHNREEVTLTSCIIGDFMLVLFARCYGAQMGKANKMHERDKNK